MLALAYHTVNVEDIKLQQIDKCNKSSAVAEIDMGLKEGVVLCPFRGALGTRLIQCGLLRGLIPYQVASSSIEPFGHNSVGCHSPRIGISVRTKLTT